MCGLKNEQSHKVANKVILIGMPPMPKGSKQKRKAGTTAGPEAVGLP